MEQTRTIADRVNETAANRASLAISRLFEQSRPRLVELAPILQLGEEIAQRCSSALSELAALDGPFAVVMLDQDVAIDEQVGRILVRVAVPEWHDHLLITIDRLLVFRCLDTMFGGEARSRTSAPERELTKLEQSVASNLAGMVAVECQKSLAPLCAFSLAAPQLVDAGSSQSQRAGVGRLMLEIRSTDGPFGIVIRCPLKALERARDKTAAEEKNEVADIDPSWSQEFRRAIGAAGIRLLASVDGPHLLLSDIAALQPGTFLELEPDALKNVILQSADRTVFVGRLGQAAGLFTVCVETPASPDAAARDD